MDQQVFDQLRTIIRRESGINLTAEKTQLLANRLQKRLRSLGVKSEHEYLHIIEVDASGEELRQLLDAISTNVTFFYRESAHFEHLANQLPKLAANAGGGLRIWCAASSSGEEPFTIAMVVKEVFGPKSNNIKILATDISTKVLKHAASAVYDGQQLAKLPSGWKSRYFEKSADADQWQVCNELRSLVTFKRLNLAKFPLPLKGPIDVIFCRNVMIYFDRELRGKLIAEFQRLIRRGGFLYLSHSEGLLGISHSLKTIGTSIYQVGDK